MGEMFCHLSAARHKGVEVVVEECSVLGEVWVCRAHQRDLVWRAILRPECVDAQEGDPLVGRCTGENEQGWRCERTGPGLYPAMPRCTAHEDQLPTRWDIEAEHDAPIIRTRWDEQDAALARRATREAKQEADRVAARARDWERLRRHGRAVLAEARARLDQQGALALE